MNLISKILIGTMAFLQSYFLVIEMFFWTKPKGLKTFGITLELAQASAPLAANQGLYNGFLAAGLVWALLHPDPLFALQLAYFFLGCVLVAGLYGAYSANKKILVVQALPAAIALASLFI